MGQTTQASPALHSALKDIHNVPNSSAARKVSQHNALDVTDLLKRRMLAPKLRCTAEEAGVRVEVPPPDAAATEDHLQSNPVYSPANSSLAHAASRLAALRASRQAAPPASPHRQRQSTRVAVQRYGEWFTGDDQELDRKLADYNLDVAAGSPMAEVQQARRAARRESWIARTQTYAGSSGASRGGDDVAGQVADVAAQLCAQLDQLVPEQEAAEDSAAPRMSLREQLQASWNGKTYYERLAAMTSEDAAELEPPRSEAVPASDVRPAEARSAAATEIRREGHAMPASPAPHARPATDGARSGGVSSPMPDSKTPGRARRLSTFNDLTEGLKALRVSGAARARRSSLGGLVKALTPTRAKEGVPTNPVRAPPRPAPASPARSRPAPASPAHLSKAPASRLVAPSPSAGQRTPARTSRFAEEGREFGPPVTEELAAASAASVLRVSERAAELADRLEAAESQLSVLLRAASSLQAVVKEATAELEEVRGMLACAVMGVPGSRDGPGQQAGGLPPRNPAGRRAGKGGGWR
ncbi:hypothetical protein F751_2199 [Auxenochlorella protothecoides]|uniref:Uncharacterized protein n=1 Tax=Auxenochlorella protothecoides TaxID=3075 RepID=A0A087SLK8_AUXPR|nr:hypothetical protein F751_2199 [Auxenochlorella protothecoides]KFM26612.1 hypothetical protein F751_2199 [Auxenochlorella protothecoides]